METPLEHLASLINSTQRQNAELMDKVTAVDRKCDLSDEVNVRLYNTILGLAEDFHRYKAHTGKIFQN